MCGCSHPSRVQVPGGEDGVCGCLPRLCFLPSSVKYQLVAREGKRGATRVPREGKRGGHKAQGVKHRPRHQMAHVGEMGWLEEIVLCCRGSGPLHVVGAKLGTKTADKPNTLLPEGLENPDLQML